LGGHQNLGKQKAKGGKQKIGRTESREQNVENSVGKESQDDMGAFALFVDWISVLCSWLFVLDLLWTTRDLAILPSVVIFP